MKRSRARARRLPVVNLWLGLIIDWIFSPLPPRTICSLSPLVHLSSLLMLLFPFAAIRPLLFLSRRRANVLSRWLPISARFPFFFPLFLPSLLPASPRFSCPSFLLARLTKMGPAASGSRFPRKLSSYKINYPPYFIAPRRSGPGCAST